MRRAKFRWLLVAVIAALSACQNLSIPEGTLRCGPGNSCPSPYRCVEGFCYSGHGPGDGAAVMTSDGGKDAAKDAPSKDVPVGDATAQADSRDAGAAFDGEPGSVEQGGACVADGQCKTGHCVDNICCDKACDDTCMACSSVFTGGQDGVCGLTRAGLNPHASRDCPAGAPEMCGNDGTCDGAGACRLFGSTQICGAAACTGAVGAQSFQPAATCDGKGKCAAPAVQSCGQYNCSPTNGCAKPCTTDANCDNGSYCASDSLCRTKLIDGAACTSANQCAHGFCADGFCCESDCTKKGCFSCARDYTGQADGKCQPVSKGKTSPRTADCKAADSKTCGLDGTCDGAGACAYFDSSTKCADPTCSGTMFTATGTCDGTGKCAAGAKTDCGQFQCGLSGCLKNCQMDSDCSAGSYCSADKTCAAKKTNGTSCTAGKECTTGFCADGVCCGSACSQTCYGCSLEKTGKADGTCSPLKAGTSRSATECPAGTKESCGNDGTCDGTGKCRSWASGTACAAGSCGTSGFTGAKTCDGAGHCAGPAPVSCGAYPCNATSGCAVSCSASIPCAGDTYCDAGTMKCAAKKAQGQACGGAGECLSGQCVDGVCCNSACGGACQSCVKATNGNADGICAAIPAGMPPKQASSCAPSGTTDCTKDGKCDGSGNCRKAAKGTKCGDAMCSVSNQAATYRDVSTCDGSGTCSMATAGDCKGYLCASTNACLMSCSKDGDCANGSHCEAPTCKPDCASNAACGTSAVCVNKRCTACGGAQGPCCASGNTCQSGLTCSSNQCVSCGKDTQPCCTSGAACGSGLTCSSNKCTACGMANQACCPSGTACGNGLSCISNKCTACPMSWTFESGTEGWTSPNSSVTTATMGGSKALRVLLAPLEDTLSVRVSFCQPQNLIDKSFRARIYLETSGSADAVYEHVMLVKNGTPGGGLGQTGLTANAWTTVSLAFNDDFGLNHPELLDAASQIGFDVIGAAGLSGSLYIDDVHVE